MSGMTAQERQEQMKQRLADMKASTLQNKSRSNTAPSSPASPLAAAGVAPRAASPGRGSFRGPRGGGPARGAARGSFRGPAGGASRRGAASRGGAPGAGAASGNAVRELGLVKAELRMLKMKYDSEVRKREGLEKQLAIMKESNAPVMKSGRATMIKKSAAGSRGSMSKPKAPAGNNIIEIISKVLSEMKNLEQNITRADQQRDQAESELMEVALLKQTADEALEEITKDTHVKLAELTSVSGDMSKLADANPSIKEPLDLLQGRVEAIRNDMLRRIDLKRINADKDKSFKRATILMQSIVAPPPSAPSLSGFNLSASGPTRAATSVRSGPRESTLLTQIKKGHSLNKIDPATLARERQEQRNNSHESMMLLNSLQDTLRNALNTRQSDMNLYEDENGDEWDD